MLFSVILCGVIMKPVHLGVRIYILVSVHMCARSTALGENSVLVSQGTSAYVGGRNGMGKVMSVLHIVTDGRV